MGSLRISLTAATISCLSTKPWQSTWFVASRVVASQRPTAPSARNLPETILCHFSILSCYRWGPPFTTLPQLNRCSELQATRSSSPPSWPRACGTAKFRWRVTENFYSEQHRHLSILQSSVKYSDVKLISDIVEIQLMCIVFGKH